MVLTYSGGHFKRTDREREGPNPVRVKYPEVTCLPPLGQGDIAHVHEGSSVVNKEGGHTITCDAKGAP